MVMPLYVCTYISHIRQYNYYECILQSKDSYNLVRFYASGNGFLERISLNLDKSQNGGFEIVS